MDLDVSQSLDPQTPDLVLTASAVLSLLPSAIPHHKSFTPPAPPITLHGAFLKKVHTAPQKKDRASMHRSNNEEWLAVPQ